MELIWGRPRQPNHKVTFRLQLCRDITHPPGLQSLLPRRAPSALDAAFVRAALIPEALRPAQVYNNPEVYLLNRCAPMPRDSLLKHGWVFCEIHSTAEPKH